MGARPSALEPAAGLEPARRPLKRAEYDQLVGLGAFDDERVELVFGDLITMPPQTKAHSLVHERLEELGRETVMTYPFGAGAALPLARFPDVVVSVDAVTARV